MNTSFFGEMLNSITERGRALLDRTRDRRDVAAARSESLADLCEELLSGRGEASGVALAGEILEKYSKLTVGPRIAFFETLANRFGPDGNDLEAAIKAWQAAPSDETAAGVHLAAESRRQELLRRLNLAPGGTAMLVRMREQLLDSMDHRKDLAAVDADFVHLFSCIDPPDRRCYAFFHPALVDEPLIFVEVALTRDIPDAVGPILATGRNGIAPDKTKVAVFYSISNCQRGLAGVSFGNFLIKQVVEEISRENARLQTYVTLSPAPEFARWLARELKTENSQALSADDREALKGLDQPGWWREPEQYEALKEPFLRAAAWYYLNARNRRGLPVDPVARFHLGNGARLERLNWLGDITEKGLAQSYGLMVNYLYDLEDIEKNHEAYAEGRRVAASSAVRRHLRGTTKDLVPVAG
jgi:malonyl-CoA decarboxylase